MGQERERWEGGRKTFVIAAMASAIGIGNLWKFPAITYEYGGAGFFFPYLLALFFFGIPLLILEITLGQKFQRGAIGVFTGINRRFGGVGLAQVFASFSIALYYNVAVGWSLIYLLASMKSPLPWTSVSGLGKCGLNMAEEFFLRNTLEVVNEDCEAFEFGDETHVVGYVLLSTFVVWFICFWALFKGTKSIRYVTYFTVIFPTITIIILMIMGVSLNGAQYGIDMYIKGVDGTYKPDEAMNLPDIWINAVAQVFFSIGVCVGIMTSFASYSPVETPIIRDSLIIAFGNTLISFVSGFFIFGAIGFVIEGGIAVDSIGGAALPFVVIPIAIADMNAPNFWGIIYFLTIFTLGIDSSFSFVESLITAIYDTQWGKKYSRKGLALVVCTLGFILSIIFTTNFGRIMNDVVDFYLTAYLVVFIGILECLSVGWLFEFSQRVKENEKFYEPLLYLAIGFWGSLFIFGILGYWVFFDYNYIAAILFWVFLAATIMYTFTLSQLSWADYFDKILLNGVGRIAKSITKLSTENGERKSWMRVFEIWWGLSIKFFIPAGLTWMLMMSIKYMADVGYKSYDEWNYIGLIFPVIGLILFIVPMIKPLQNEQDKKDMRQALHAALSDKLFKKINLAQIQNIKAKKEATEKADATKSKEEDGAQEAS